MTKQELTDAGFIIESLPSGNKTNILHKLPFDVNGVDARISKGMYTRTFQCSINDLPTKINNIYIIG